MCGCIEVENPEAIQAFVEKLFPDLTDTIFPIENKNVRPTDEVALVTGQGALVSRWGIKPDWSKRPLINAKQETIAEKKTFARAFSETRCIVPCTAWYEWRDEGKPRKTKYRFCNVKENPLLMAAVYFPEYENYFVTLTTEPLMEYKQYHHRMPVLLDSNQAELWLRGLPEEAIPLLKGNFRIPSVSEVS